LQSKNIRDPVANPLVVWLRVSFDRKTIDSKILVSLFAVSKNIQSV